MRKFVHTAFFDKQWEQLGLNDDDLRSLQSLLIEHPDIGDVIQGTGGVRKVRFAANSKGKRGGARVIYVDFVIHESLFLLSVYGKNKKQDISENEKEQMRKLINIIEKELDRRGRP